MKKTIINSLLTLKNASALKKEMITCSYNRFLISVLKCLYKEGFILYYKILCDSAKKPSKIVIGLQYSFGKESSINSIKFLSTPSKLKFLTYKEICKISDKKSILFISTDLGIQTQMFCKKNNIGGSPFFLIN